MRFSERIGRKQVRQELQIDGMDTPLRNRLWNTVVIILPLRDVGGDLSNSSYSFAKKCWHNFFKLPIDGIPYSAYSVRNCIRDWFFKAEWYEVYDFLEFIVTLIEDGDVESFKSACNIVLESECSGYRFVGDIITPIVSGVEIQEVEQAVEGCSAHQLEGARNHLDAALEKMSDRQNPDYRNSIKESISAVESVCVIISGDPKATLRQTLKKIKDSVGLHPALEKGMSSIYGYTSDADGIRHAMIEESDCDLADAKYMLVSCSAFINYLIMKASKAGLIDKD
jgi:hypothetical protein